MEENWKSSQTEVYMEKVHDLLGSSPGEKLSIKQGAQSYFVEGLTWLPVRNTKEMNQVL